MSNKRDQLKANVQAVSLSDQVDLDLWADKILDDLGILIREEVVTKQRPLIVG